jgi:hypothetical protein
MPIAPGGPSLSSAPIEKAEIISKTMIRAVSYTPLREEGATAYPVSRTDREVSRDRREEADARHLGSGLSDAL